MFNNQHHQRDILIKTIVFLSAFVSSYLIFYIFPSLFHAGSKMKQLQLLPFIDPIGVDFKANVDFINSWVMGTDEQFSKFNIYPPLTSLFFLPFIFLEFKISYILMTSLSFISLFYITILFPFRMLKDSNTFYLSIPIFIISLFTYPFLFEIERGQFNLIAMALCFYGLELNKKGHFFGHILFLISIQMKLFPAIFVFLFAKKDIKKYIYLGGVSILSLFLLGVDKFKHFLNAVIEISKSNIFISEVNLSTGSFFKVVSNVLTERGKSDLIPYINIIQILVMVFMVCVLCWLIYDFFKKENNYYKLLLGCSILTLLIPQVSHDYKLSYLAGPFICFLFSYLNKKYELILIWVASFCYCSFLWHFWEHKQAFPLFKMNTPGLLIILFIVLLSTISFSNKKNAV